MFHKLTIPAFLSFLGALLLFWPTGQTFAYTINLNLKDGGDNPITTALDLRVSLWDAYDVRSEDVDGNGDINTSASHYGGYQATWTITPDGDGYFVPVTYGYY